MMKTLFEINEICNFNELCQTYVEMLNERDKMYANYNVEGVKHINDLLTFIQIKMYNTKCGMECPF